MKRIIGVPSLIVILLLAVTVSGVLAFSSDNYRLDWFTLLTGSGGTASSSHYSVGFTVGQTVGGDLGSASYAACLGYWCREETYRLFLPVVLRG